MTGLSTRERRVSRSFQVFIKPLAVLFGGAITSMGAHASCVRYPQTIERFVSIDLGTVLVPADLAIGVPIVKRSFPMGGGGGPADLLLLCVGGGSGNGIVTQGTLVPNYTDLYSTAVAGVGIRLRWGGSQGKTFPFVENYAGMLFYTVYLGAGAQLEVELVKTAAVTGNGPLSGVNYAQVRGDGDNLPAVTVRMLANGTRILTPSCSVDTGSRNVSVQFGNVPLNSFGGAGSTSASRPFSIRLNCKAGQNAENTIYLRMDATPDASNEPGVLQISQAGGSAATGVGIQVLDQSNAGVKFGDDVLVGPSKDGSYMLPFTARYYQTGSRVTPGSANGTATFTLSYK